MDDKITKGTSHPVSKDRLLKMDGGAGHGASCDNPLIWEGETEEVLRIQGIPKQCDLSPKVKKTKHNIK